MTMLMKAKASAEETPFLDNGEMRLPRALNWNLVGSCYVDTLYPNQNTNCPKLFCCLISYLYIIWKLKVWNNFVFLY